MPHDLHVELDLNEEAQLHAEALVQVAAKRKEEVHYEQLRHQTASDQGWRTVWHCREDGSAAVPRRQTSSAAAKMDQQALQALQDQRTLLLSQARGARLRWLKRPMMSSSSRLGLSC